MKLLELYRWKPSYDVASKLSEVEADLKLYPPAAAHAREALDLQPVEEPSAEAGRAAKDATDAKLAQAKEHVAMLAIRMSGLDVEVAVDDRVQIAPPRPRYIPKDEPVFDKLSWQRFIYLEPGQHTVEFRWKGREPRRDVLHAEVAKTYELSAIPP